MWILARLLTAAIVGVIRYLWRQTGVDRRRTTGEVAWVFTQSKSKGRVIANSFGVAFAHPVFFRLSPERGWDRFFKQIGFAHEMQTGDAAFDEAVYVACDHPALALVLQEDAGARAAILSLFRNRARVIYADGANLWVARGGDSPPDATELGYLTTVRTALEAVPAEDFQTLRDPYFWRALVIGALVWSLAFYGVPGIVENVMRPASFYFDWRPIIDRGLMVAVGAVAGLALLTWLLLRNSSRSHRVLVENLIVLILGLPFSAVELVSDANIGLDPSPATVVRAAVPNAYTTVTHDRHGSHTHYHLSLRPETGGAFPLPASIEVPFGEYALARRSGKLAVTMHAGALGVPWVEKIHAVPAN